MTTASSGLGKPAGDQAASVNHPPLPPVHTRVTGGVVLSAKTASMVYGRSITRESGLFVLLSTGASPRQDRNRYPVSGTASTSTAAPLVYQPDLSCCKVPCTPAVVVR